MKKLNTIKEIQVKNNQKIESRGADLFIFENLNFLFNIKRIFTINNNNILESRGSHANKSNDQIISCVSGKVNLLLKDGIDEKSIDLFDSNLLVYVPRHIWGETNFIEKNSILVCYSSENYKEESYIRDYDEFMRFRKGES